MKSFDRGSRSFRPARWCRAGLVALVAAAVPMAAQGQACIAEAARSSQFSIGGDVHRSNGTTGYSMNSQANLPGPLSMGAFIGTVDHEFADDNVTSVGANLALEVGRGAISVCPVAAASYDFWSGDFAGVDLDFSVWRIPVGLGVGTRLGGGTRFALIPAVQAGVVHTRFGGSAALGNQELFGRTDTTTDFYADGALTLEVGRLFVRGGLFHVFEDDSDPAFRIGLGVIF